MKRAIFNWSGGKDSAMALHKVINEKEFEICSLLTSVNSEYNRISMHGVRTSLLEKQAQNIGLPLEKLELPESPNMETYNQLMSDKISGFKSQDIDHSIFGDIFLEDLKKYREEQLKLVSMKAVFPLWQKDTKELVTEFINEGFKAITVCVNGKYLNQSHVGKIIDFEFLNSLPDNVDPCGENGEFHSFVFDGPIFNKPIQFTIGEIISRSYKPSKDEEGNSVAFDTEFFFCDLLDN